METSKLIGVALNWAVAKAWQPVYSDKHLLEHSKDFQPSTEWAQGGPIIERERIEIGACGDQWRAVMHLENESMFADGPTPLIAAMRCYIASKLGENVEIPNDLI